CRQGNPEVLCHFCELLAFEVPKGKGEVFFSGEPLKDSIHSAAGLPRGIIDSVVAYLGQLTRLPEHEPAPRLAPPNRAVRCMDSELPEPSAERKRVLERVSARQSFDEHVVEHVVHVDMTFVTEHAAEKA